MVNGIREPRQKRSIEKKEKIIKAAYELFSENGYYGTNTPEIAKKAGVSTGIVYGYFKDKRDILFYVLKIYIHDTASPVMDYLNSIPENVTLSEILENIITLTEFMHKKNANLHNILHSLAFVNADVNEEFLSLEKHITLSVSQKFGELGYKIPQLEEKIHIAMNVIQSFAHESTYDKHDYIDYAVMKKDVIDLLLNLLQNTAAN